MLRRRGARVGLLDADVYGPSLPSLLGLSAPSVCFTDVSDNDSDCERLNEAAQPRRAAKSRQRLLASRGAIRYEDEAPVAAAEAEPPPPKASLLKPLSVWGVKHMSYGFIAKKNPQQVGKGADCSAASSRPRASLSWPCDSRC